MRVTMPTLLARRAVVVVVLGSIVACSGLGFCWTQFAVRAHGCCERQDTSAPAKPCASVVAKAGPVLLIPPSEAAPDVSLAPPVWAAELASAALVPTLPVKPPPLVLRI